MQKTNPNDLLWHSINAEEATAALNTDAVSGLSSEEAQKRLREYGPNALPAPAGKNAFIRFLKHFNDILIYVLLAAALVTLVLGHYVDTAVILLVAVINACIGFVQENKAEKALEDIKNLLSLKAEVLRDGKRQEIEAETLVPGDVVLLAPGDKVPADLRLIRTDNLTIEESTLTGEAVPSEKEAGRMDEDTVLADRENMAFSSTTVSAGTGLGLVVGTGTRTEIGKISEMIAHVEPITTPLLRQTSSFGKTVSVVIVALSALIYIFAYFFRSYEPGELLLAVISLAVGAIPEGLPAILSIILAVGVQNMAKRKAIVRTLPSVETLGSVSVICSDKTGTLTKNEMTVTALVTKDDYFKVTGSGYSSEGEILKDGAKADFSKEDPAHRLITCMYLCNDASIAKTDDGQWEVRGDPTEGALIALYKKSDFEKLDEVRLDTIPFDSKYKYMATLVKGDDENINMIKGAPDALIAMADFELTKDGIKPIDKKFWNSEVKKLAQKGQRIIGAAYENMGGATGITHEDIYEDIVFLGLAGIIDPPRPEVVASIRECHEAGISVKMITGDHADTAKTIGHELGIGDGEKAITGKELEHLDEAAFEQAAHDYDIFARTSPEHKLRLVKALQARGAICAMTGDGVNDAPALKKADVGVAMGIKGTEVTKDSSEIVLADDNFSTIVAAVEEGRKVYDNLKKTILFILPTNGAQALLIVAAILFGILMPLTSVQILWVNMVTSVTVSLALAFEPLEPGTMRRPPRDPKTPLLGAYFIWRIAFVSILLAGRLWLSIHMTNQGMPLDMVRTITMQTIVAARPSTFSTTRASARFCVQQGVFRQQGGVRGYRPACGPPAVNHLPAVMNSISEPPPSRPQPGPGPSCSEFFCSQLWKLKNSLCASLASKQTEHPR
jgi:ATPase, P-type (transporting), HAD superfamily, subfamily IC